jgi:uncharacterized membrane protein YcaP (DUF421 family)
VDIGWHELVTMGIPIAEKAIRTIAVYALLVIGLRLFGKRELGHLNPLDFIVLLLISNTVQNAIIGRDNSLAGGLLGAGLLFVANAIVVRLSFAWPGMRRLIEGQPEVLVRDGEIVREALDRNFITPDELAAEARKQGMHDLGAVEAARLEVSGALSFVHAEGGPADKFHREVLERLAAIERKLSAA